MWVSGLSWKFLPPSFLNNSVCLSHWLFSEVKLTLLLEESFRFNFFFSHVVCPLGIVSRHVSLFLQTRRSSSSSSRGGSTSSPNGRGSCSNSKSRKMSNCVGTNGSSNASSAPQDNGYEEAANCKIGRQRSSASMEGNIQIHTMFENHRKKSHMITLRAKRAMFLVYIFWT